MVRRSDVWALILLTGISFLLWLPRFHGPIDFRYDGAVYYILGTSLAEGKGYRLLNEPGEIQAIQYPPGLPILVAIHQWVLGTNEPVTVGHALRLSYFVIFTLYVLAMYGMARQFLEPVYALAAVAITAINHNIFFWSDLLFAEIPFALVAFLFIFLNRKSDKPLFFLLTAVAGITAYLLRAAGIALLAAWIFESLCQKKWKQAALRCGVSLLPVVAWQGYIAWVTAGEEYRNPVYPYQRAAYLYYNVSYLENLLLVQPFRPEEEKVTRLDLLKRVWRNLIVMPESLGAGISSQRGDWEAVEEMILADSGFKDFKPPGASIPVMGDRRTDPRWVAIPLNMLGCLVIGGTILWLVRREWLISSFVVFSVGLICFTPWPDQILRYLMPFTSFLVIGMVLLLATFIQVCKRGFSGFGKYIGLSFFVLVLLLISLMELYSLQRTFREFNRIAGLFWYDETWTNYEKSLAWLKEKSKPGDVIATWAPQWAYLWTGQETVMPPMEVDFAKGQQLLDSVPAKYLILDEIDFLDLVPHYTRPIITAFPEKWQRIYISDNRKTEIFERKHSEKSDPAK